jgi:hypothetical protein
VLHVFIYYIPVCAVTFNVVMSCDCLPCCIICTVMHAFCFFDRPFKSSIELVLFVLLCILFQCIWGGFILIQYNYGKLWNSGIIRTATKQKSKQREFRSHLRVKGETGTCHYTFSTSVNLIYNLLPNVHQRWDGSRILSNFQYSATICNIPMKPKSKQITRQSIVTFQQ